MSKNVLLCVFSLYLSSCSQWDVIEWSFSLPQEKPLEQTLEELKQHINPLRPVTGEHQQRTNPLPSVQLDSIALSPNNQWLALADNDGNDGVVRIWNLNGEKRERKRLAKNVNRISAIAFSPTGQQIAFADWDKTIHLWDLKLTKEIPWLSAESKAKHRDTIVTIAYSPDGHYLASGSYDNKIIIWDVTQGKIFKQLEKHSDKITSLAFSSDGKWLASASWDGKIYLWDWRTDQIIKPLPHPDSVLDIAFSQNNRWLASGADDGIVRLWNIESKQIEALQHSNAPVTDVAFSPDDELLASITENNTVQLMNMQNKSATSLKVPGNFVLKLIFSQDGHSLIVPSADGSIRIYAVSTEQLQSFLVIGKLGNWLSCDIETRRCLRGFSVIEWFVRMKEVILALLLSSLLVYFLVVYFRFYRHPLIVALSAQNNDLLTLPLPQLVIANRLLRRTHRLQIILESCQILPTTFTEAIAFIKGTPLEQVEILVKKRLNVDYQQQHRDLFVIQLPDDFPLNLASCLFYFPHLDKHPTTILQELEWQEELRWQKVVIITLDLEQQQKLRPYGENVTTLWIVPNMSELTLCLLSPNPIHEFAKIVATQLKVTHISPYQTQGGINKKDLFFGRTSVLTFILHRHLSNYLVVGGRQIGKSSLLKYLDRYYHDQPDITCYYLSLHSENIVEKLAHLLKLPSRSRLDEIVTYLVSTKQPHLFLIDEADQFIQTEIQQNYPTLTCFHNLSEEGHGYFVLAGFWQLYQAAVLDYHSPLRNFGEIITLAELESEACHDLIVKPLQFLNIRIASEILIKAIIDLSGQRANLIAIICNEMLKDLDITTRVLDEAALSQVLNSNKIAESLSGWENLTNDEQNNHLDRFIIYTTVEPGKFTLTTLLNELNNHDQGSYSLEQVKQSLARLTLSFIIKKQQQHYTYCVPLLRNQLLQADLKELLKYENLTDPAGF